MADGSVKPISQIVAGDHVLGGDGGSSLVLRVYTPQLGRQPIYALNSGKPFVTGSHPLVLSGGEFTIDELLGYSPHAVDDSQNLLEGTERNTFNRLTRIGRSGAPYSSVHEEELHSIRSTRLRGDTQLYHLHVSGDGTYFTEGVKFKQKIHA